MDEHLASALSKPRFFSSLVTAFGALAVTLALIGIYAMMAWSVSERRREFAIRLALGARSPRWWAWSSARRSSSPAMGIVVGLAGARAATGVLTGLLFGVQPDRSVRLRADRRRSSASSRSPHAMCRCAAPFAWTR